MGRQALLPLLQQLHGSVSTPPMPPCSKCGAPAVRQYYDVATGSSTSRCPAHDGFFKS